MSFNRLIDETSPYLLQHKDNPVHWWSWGPEALKEAQANNKPILLSVGYAACHWCHVMAHESFEDQETAQIMNDLFINIKVDREERPDIDTIYMQALHKMGEQGGWPLTMFLTPKAEPFWGGTYFPPKPRYGRPSFKAVLKEVARIYNEEQETIKNNTTVILRHLQHRCNPSEHIDFSKDKLKEIAERLCSIIDYKYGGIQGAPKFPQTSLFEFLWNIGVMADNDKMKKAVTTTLNNICQGGIYDHLAGGFARYSVDDKWLVPHFEKMLYDNAQLVSLMTQVWQETKDPILHQRIHETCEWVLNEMIGEHNGFASALDADSEGVEGKFYIWSKKEIYDVLGNEVGADFCEIYGVTEAGNFEGENILNRLEAKEFFGEDKENNLQSSRKRLLSSRTSRIRPSWDDKILSDWNGLMISSLAYAGYIFNQSHWIKAAIKAYESICKHMMVNGRLKHAYRSGQAKAPATASDYANMIEAALKLFQIQSDDKFLKQAIEWTETMESHYWDPEEGGYFFTANDTDDVIIRTKSATDDATPNANSIMVSNLNTLFLLTGDIKYQKQSEDTIKAFSLEASENLFAHTRLYSALVEMSSPILIRMMGPDIEQMQTFLATLKELRVPGSILLLANNNFETDKTSPLTGKLPVDEKPTIYICTENTCLPPITEGEELKKTLNQQKLRLK